MLCYHCCLLEVSHKLLHRYTLSREEFIWGLRESSQAVSSLGLLEASAVVILLLPKGEFHASDCPSLVLTDFLIIMIIGSSADSFLHWLDSLFF
jgi:hypothetical protein